MERERADLESLVSTKATGKGSEQNKDEAECEVYEDSKPDEEEPRSTER